MKKLLLNFILVFTSINFVLAQDNVGIGTLTPNANALVDMVSNNKGLLIPRLTSAERLAIPTAGIVDEGMLVYDTDLSLFHYWDGGQWIAFPLDNDPTNELQNLLYSNDTLYISDGNLVYIPSGVGGSDDQQISITGDTLILEDGGFVLLTSLVSSTLLNDSTLVINGDTINFNADNDTDPSNELQDLGINGDSLTITGGTSISINDLSNSTVLNDSTIIVNGDTLIINGSGVIDTDDQILTLSNDTLFIQDGNFVVLTDNVNDADFDPTNELQDLAVVGDSLIINGGANVFLGDLTATNVLNDTTLVINGDTLVINGSSELDTDDQTLTLSNDTLFIEDGNFVVLPSGAVNTDDQVLSISGDTLFLEDGGFVLLNDLVNSAVFNDSTIIVNGDTLIINGSGGIDTDDQILTLSNDTLFIQDGNFVVLTDNVNDADFDSTNELQDLAVVGDSLIINGGANVFLGDLTSSNIINDSTLIINGDTLTLPSGGINTDDQTLTLSNDTLFIEDGNFVVLPSGVVNTDDQVLSISGDTLLLENGGFVLLEDLTNSNLFNDTTLVINGDTINLTNGGVDTDDQNLTIVNDTLFISEGNFVILTDNVNDADFDPTNELQDLAVVGDSLIINGGTNVFLGDITNVTNLGDSAFVINGDTITTTGYGTDDQNLTLSNDTLFIEDGNFVVLPSGVVNTDDQVLSISGDTLFLEDGGFVLLEDLTTTNLFNDTTLVINGDTVILSTGGIGSDDQILTLSNDTLFIQDGNFVVLTDNVNDADFDPTNELQDLAVVGDSLIINGGTNVFLGDLTNVVNLGDSAFVINGDTIPATGFGTDDQNLTAATLTGNTLQIDIENGNSVSVDLGPLAAGLDSIYGQGDSLILVSNGGLDTAYVDLGGVVDTDDQFLTLSNDTLLIDGGNFVVLTDNVNDADFDPTNELQDLAVVGDSLIINGGTNVFLGDLTATNIINDTTLVINGDTLTLPSGGINTDDQTLTLSNDTLFIEDGNFVVLPSGVVNTDDQVLSISGDTLFLEDGGFVLLEDLTTTNLFNDTTLVINGDTVILSTGGIGSDDQILTLSNDTLFIQDGNFVVLTDNVNDADFDPTNELQDLAVVGDSLIINGGTNVFLGDLTNVINLGDSAFVINGDTIPATGFGTDDQNLTAATLTGNTLQIDIENGNSVSVDLGPLAAGLDSIYGQGDSLILVSNGGLDTAFVDLGGVVDTDDQILTLSNDTLFIQDGNFVVLTDNVNDADFDPTNELQDLAVVGDSLIINGGTNVFLGDLTSSNIVNDTTLIINGDTLTLPSGGINTDDQNLTLSNDTLFIEDGNFVVLPSGLVNTDDQVLSISGDTLFLEDGGFVLLEDLTTTNLFNDTTLVINGDTVILSTGSIDTDDQILTLSNDTLFIQDGNFVVLTDNVNDADFDSTNELQDLAVVGDSLIINGGTNVFLGDLTSSNIFNDTTLIINGDTLTLPSGGINTDDQNLTLSNDTLFIEDGNFVVLPSGVVNTDDQVLSISGDTLFLEDGGFVLLEDLTTSNLFNDTTLVINGDTITLSTGGIDTDDQTLTLSNDTLFIQDGNFVVLTDNVNDADFDPTNELQDLVVVGDSLIINGGTNVFLGDLTSSNIINDSTLIINGDTLTLPSGGINTDDQNLTLINDTLFIEDGNFVVLPSGLVNTDDQVLSISGDTLFLEDGGFVLLEDLTTTNLFNDTTLVINGDTITLSSGGIDTDDQTLTLSNDTLFIQDGNFVVLTDNVNDADFDPTNELQDLAVVGDSLIINGGTNVFLGDLTTTNVLNDTTLVINGDTLIINGSGGINTDNQNLTLSNDTLFIEDGNFVVLPSGVVNTDDQVLSISGDTLFLEDGGFVLLEDLTTTNLFNDSTLVINGDTVILSTGGIDTDDQILTLSNDTLFIQDGNFVVLTDNVNDADFDPTNELQDLAVVGDSLIINGGTNVFLGDLTQTNVLNDTTLIINGDTLTINGSGGIDTDDQTLTLSNDTLFIQDGNFVVLPPSTDDQNLTAATLTGNTLQIDIENGSSVSVDLGPLAAGLDTIYGQGDSLILVSNGGLDTAFVDLGSTTDTDDQFLTLSNDTLFIDDGNFVVLTDNVNDADFDPTNELQDLGVVGDSLIINNGANVFLGDLTTTNVLNDTTLVINGDTLIINGSGGINTDNQNLTLSNDTLFIEDGNFVVLPSGVVNTDDQALSISGDTLFLEDGGFVLLEDLTTTNLFNDSTLVINGDTVILSTGGIDTDDQILTLSNDTLFIQDGNFVVLTDNVNDADFDPTNELQDLAVLADSLIINGGTNVFLGDLTQTNVLNDTTLIINGDTLTINGSGGIDTDDQTLTLSNDTLFIQDGNFVVLPPSTDDQNLTAATLTGNTLQIDIENGSSVSVDLGPLAAGLDTIYGQGDSLILVSNGGLDTAFVDLGSTTDTDDQFLTLSNDTLFIDDGNFVVLTDNVNDADFDPTNELQDLAVVGDSLIINGGTNVFIGDLTSSNIINDTTLIINGDTLTLPSGGIDTDDQNLTLSNDTLFIEDGNFVVLPPSTDDQNLTAATLTGNTLQIDIENGSSVSVDLGPLAAGLDTIYGQGDSLILVSNGGVDTAYVDLGSTTDTDDQILTLSNDTLFIQDGNFVVLTDNVNDADFDPTNELQDLGINGDSLTINGGASISINDLSSSTVVNDSTIVVNGDTLIINGSSGIDTDDQTLTLSNDTLFITDGNFVVLTDNVNDADFDPTNELQDLAVIGDSLIINGGTNVFLGDLTQTNVLNDTTLIINGDTLTINGSGGIDTDDQTLTLSNDTLFIQDGNFVVLPPSTDDQNLTAATLTGNTLQIDIENGSSVSVDLGPLAAGLDTIYGQGDSLILVSNGGVDTAYVDLGSTTDTDDQILTLSNDTLFIQDGNFVILTDNVNDADFDPTNELQDLGINGDSITINGGASISINDISNSTVLNDSTILVNGDTLIVNGSAGVDTDDQTLTLSNDTLFIADGNFVILTDNINDADFDPTNELQDLAVVGDSLIINGGTSVFLGDLTATNIINDTTLIINGDTLTLPSGAIDTDDQILTLSNDTLFIEDGNFVVLTDNVNDADFDPTNELQDLGLNGTLDSLTISGGQSIALSDIQDGTGTDDQNLSGATLTGNTLQIDIENGSSVSVDLGSLAAGLDSIYGQGDSLILVSNGGVDTAYVDLGSTTDTDDQILTLSNDTLFIQDGNFVILTDNVNDADFDPTNELQDLGINGDSITINGGASISINDISNSTVLNDSTILVNGDTLIVNGSAGVDTDDQTLTLSNDTLFIADGNFVILTDNINDADFDPTNELQDLAVVGDSLIINGGTSVFLGDLTATNIINDTTLIINGDTLTLPSGAIDTDDQILTLSNDTLFIEDGNFVVLTDNVNDADFDPTNELQDLGLNGTLDSLTISGGQSIALSEIQDGTGTDDQNLTGASLTGNTLQIDIENGSSVSVDLGSLAAGLDSIYGQGDSLILISNGGVDTAFVDLGGFADTDDQILTLSNDTLFIQDGNFVVLTDNVNDADFDSTNELQDLAVVGDSLIINGGTSVFLGDLTATNIINDTTLIINGDTLTLPSGAIDTDDQTLSLSNDTLFIEDGNFVVLTDNVNDADFDPTNELQDLGLNGTLDSLTISGGQSIALSELQDGTGTDNQILSLSNDTIFLEDGGFVVLPAGTVDTDEQDLTGSSLAANILTIDIENGASTSIDLSGLIDDADADPTNELQDLGINGDSITINGGASISINDISNSTVLNDSTIVVNGDTLTINGTAGVDTDDQTLSIVGDQLTIADGNTITLPDNVNDADFDPTNELQDLVVVGDSLIINGGTNVYLGDLTSTNVLNDSTLVINGDTLTINGTAGVDTDDQTLSIVGDQLTIADGNTITLPDNVNDADFDPTNELQDLVVVGDSLIINGGTNVYLGDLTSTNVLNDSTLVINGDTLTINGTAGVDTDDQTLSIVGDQLTIADGNTITLPADLVDDADADPTNELQDLVVVGDSLIINGGTNVYLGDLTSTNVLNDSTLVINGDTLTINGTAGVDTDDQTLSIVGDQLTIADGNTITLPADLVDDADADPTNELQDLGINGDSITINGGTSISINDISNSTVLNDSTIVVNGDTLTINGTAGVDTDDQTLSIVGDQLTIADGNTITLPADLVDDADADPTNELQDLGINGDSITINGGTSVSINDISNSTVLNDSTIVVNGDTLIINGIGEIDTDDQTLSIVGDQLTIANGNTVTLPDNVDDADADPTNELQDLGINGDSITINGGTSISINDVSNSSVLNDSTIVVNGDTLVINGSGDVDTDDQTLSIVGNQLTIADGNTVSLPDNVDDADADSTNELQDLGINGDSITINGGASISINDVSNSSVLNDSTIVVNGDTLTIIGNGDINTDDQVLSISNDTIFLEDGGFVILPSGAVDTDDQFIDQLTLQGDTMLQISLDGDGVAPVELDLSPIVGAHNTLDEAYDEGGPGAGRIIDADTGAVEIQNVGGLLVGDGHINTGERNLISGNGNNAFANDVFVSGSSSTAAGNSSTAMGSSTQSLGIASFAAGNSTIASGDAASAFGNGANAQGNNSFAAGLNANAEGANSIAMGSSQTGAAATDAVAIGSNNNASGPASIAMGSFSNASGDQSVAIGNNANALGNESTAMGANTQSLGIASFAAGNSTIASGDAASAFGNGANAQGNNSFAAGLNANAEGANSIAMGSSQTGATATDAAAIGSNNNASGPASIAMGSFSNASGDQSVAIGNNANALGNESTAMGANTQSLGIASFAAGNSTVAFGDGATAFGNGTNAGGDNSFASGLNSNAAGENSIAIGSSQTAAAATNAAAIGSNNNASGPASIAMGSFSSASGDQSVAIGNNANAIGNESTAMGANTQSLGIASFAAGNSTVAFGDGATAFGNGTNAGGDNSFASGLNADAAGENSIAIGSSQTAAAATNAAAIGSNNNASGPASIAMGSFSSASGDQSVAIGNNANAIGNESTAMGANTQSLGIASFAAGNSTIASGDGATAFGNGSNAGGDNSLATGLNANAEGVNSIAMGSSQTGAAATSAASIGDNNTASGPASIAMGSFSSASGDQSVAIGNNANAIGNESTAMGANTQSLGIASFAAGNSTIASGDGATTFGNGSNAGGVNSVAMGTNVLAPSYSETVIGIFNDSYVPASATIVNPADRLFTIGNGTSVGTRSNAVTVLKSGNVGIGDLTLNPSNLLHLNNGVIDPLRIENLETDTTLDEFMVVDANGVVHLRDLTSISGGTAPRPFQNLSISGNQLSIDSGNTVTLPINDDADWFVQGSASVPSAIGDNIYTQGNVAIGTSTPSTNRLRVLSDATTHSTGVAFFQSGSNPGGISTAFLNQSTLTDVSQNFLFDNVLTGTNNGTNYAIRNRMNNNGTGAKYGVYNDFDFSAPTGSKYGLVNRFEGASGLAYGIHNQAPGAWAIDGQFRGLYNDVAASGNGARYGVYTTISGTGTGDKYGEYINVNSSAGGTHYGIFSEVLKTGSWAGYFLGDVYVGTNASNGYNLPAVDGTANYVMQTDGSGQASWVDPASFGSTDTDDQVIDQLQLSGTVLSISLQDDGVAPETVDLNSLANDWKLTGNAGTNENINFLGTTDNQDLRFRQNNTWVGSFNTGDENYFIGRLAGQNTTPIGFDGVGNTGMGDLALSSNTTGRGNSAFGRDALQSNTTGENNAAIGASALNNNTIGDFNIAIGTLANFLNETGDRNIAVGLSALNRNISSSENIGLGNSSLFNHLTGDDNIAIGNSTMSNHLSGSNNIAIGTSALSVNSVGTGNVAIGHNAGFSETGSNTLYIENSNSASPLIYGEFDTDLVKVNGDLGVGNVTGAPSNTLHVNSGAADPVRIENLATDASLNNIMVTDANGVVHIRDASSIAGDGNTLDEAYDEGGFGAGRIINATNGAVEIQSSGGLIVGDGNTVGGNTNFIAGQNNSAVGNNAAVLGSQNDASGNNSVAFGNQNNSSGANSTTTGVLNTASGTNAVAMGGGNTASGIQTAAFGSSNISSGDNSFSANFNNEASGRYSTALGASNFARSNAETVIGMNATDYAPNAPVGFDSDDRLFVIGKGINPSNRSNALTMLKSGNMGLGENATVPTHLLHLNNGATDPLRIEGLATDATLDNVMVTDANGVVHVRDASSIAGDGNTLDEAYDEGGAGAGRIIAADAGDIVVDGSNGDGLDINTITGAGNNEDAVSASNIRGGSTSFGFLARAQNTSGNNSMFGVLGIANGTAVTNNFDGYTGVFGSAGHPTNGTVDLNTVVFSVNRYVGLYGTLNSISDVNGSSRDAVASVFGQTSLHNTSGGTVTGSRLYAGLFAGNGRTLGLWGQNSTYIELIPAWQNNDFDAGVIGYYNSAANGGNNGASTGTPDSYMSIETNVTDATAKDLVLQNRSTGNVGIGENAPTTKLHVSSTSDPLRIEGLATDATLDNVMVTDANGVVHVRDASTIGAGGNTLDEAYDEGGAGAGRTIIADNGDVRIAGEDGLIVTGTIGSGQAVPSLPAGAKMIFSPRYGAFRAGFVDGTQWDDLNIGQYSIACGFRTTASGTSSIAFGNNSVASGLYGFAGGAGSTASGTAAFAYGINAQATTQYAFAFGSNTQATGLYSFAAGDNSVATNSYAFSYGFFNTAAGNGSIAMGSGNDVDAPSLNGVALGNNNDINEDYGVGLGHDNTVAGLSSVAVGDNNNIQASGLYSFAAGRNNDISDTRSVPLGYGVALGNANTVTHTGAIAIGNNNTATNDESIAIGRDNTSNGLQGVAMGYQNTANGSYSIALGRGSVANNLQSVAIGRGNITKENSEQVFGNWNDTLNVASSNRVFTIGNGFNNSARSNALVVLQSGFIGINTNNPTERLSIAGSQTTTGTITSGLDITSTNGDIITAAGNGVINAGGGAMTPTINYIGDAYVVPTNVNGDEDLYIADDLQVNGQAYKPGGGAWVATSDRRLKKDIEDYKDGLNELLRIRPVSFKYNNYFEGMDNGETYVGVIAQEIQEIAPYTVEEVMMGQQTIEDEFGNESILKEGEAFFTFDGTALTYMTINAVQEQQVMIEELRDAAFGKNNNLSKEVEAIKAENEALKAANEALQEENEAIQSRLDNIESMLEQLLEDK